ncbi:hypothetical protein D1007_22197 [Hordeum vulgare]|nr:hypothetical protein D1007_22197 [Hordeum vulgare]
MTAATGGSVRPVWVLLSPVSGTAQQRQKQRDEGALLMLTLPRLQCAESVYFHDPDEAESVLLTIAELAVTLGTSRQPVASYLAEAMSARIFSSCLGLYAPLLHALRHGGMPTIRPNWLSASMESLQITRKRLSNLALDQSFEFEFCQVANKVGNLDPVKMVVETRRREVIAVHRLQYSLHDSNTLCIIRR